MKFTFAGLSIKGPMGTRLYFRACPEPCGSRRPCEHRGRRQDPWAQYLRTHGHEEQAAKWEGRGAR
jgi:hypothetical protein